MKPLFSASLASVTAATFCESEKAGFYRRNSFAHSPGQCASLALWSKATDRTKLLTEWEPFYNAPSYSWFAAANYMSKRTGQDWSTGKTIHPIDRRALADDSDGPNGTDDPDGPGDPGNPDGPTHPGEGGGPRWDDSGEDPAPPETPPNIEPGGVGPAPPPQLMFPPGQEPGGYNEDYPRSPE